MTLTDKQISMIHLFYKGYSARRIEKKLRTCRKELRKVIKTLQLPTFKELMFEEGLVRCSKCEIYKKAEDFRKGGDKITGLTSWCRLCENRPTTQRGKETQKKWREKNKEHKKLQDRKYRERNLEKIRAYRKTPEAKELRRIHDKRYYEKLKNNSELLLKVRVKSAMSGSIRHSKKNPYFKILGYTLQDLKGHLESKFKGGMSWENYGRGGWHIDHITPLILFNTSTEEGFKEAWSLGNLQPLWERDNCRKGSLYKGVRYYRNSKNGGTAGDRRARG